MRYVAVTAVAVAILGCASAPPPLPSHLKIDRRVGERPAIGSNEQRSVGETIYEIYNYEIRTDSSTRLLGPLAVDVLAADFQLGPNDPLVPASQEGERVHCSATRMLRVVGQPNTAHVCLRDPNDDHVFDEWRSPDGPPARRGWAKLKQPVGYKEETTVEMAQSGDGFKYELLYQGVSAGVVSILYREYVDSLVRPAFQQDLSYTLGPEGPTAISFRSIQITIHSADNNGIRYTVNRGLSTEGP